MLVEIADVLSPEEVAAFRSALQGAEWKDGRATAGDQSKLAKRNGQLAEDDPLARRLGDAVLDALGRSPRFVSAALPAKTYPPLFNHYGVGQDFGFHVDNAIRPVRGTSVRVRTDLSATLFLEDPDSYDGGELTIEDTYGFHQVKLPAGSLVLYPGSSLHRVEPVTRGERTAAFFWVQSMVREDARRALLFDMDETIQALSVRHGQTDPEVIRISATYHNLLRMWADA